MTDPREPREPVEGDEELAEPALEDESTQPVTGGEGVEVDEAEAVDQPGAADDAASMDQGPLPTAGATPSGAPPVGAAVPSSEREAAPSSRTGKPSGGGSGTIASDVSELPYVDDPVSKWWVGLVVGVFVVLFVWAIFLADAFDGFFESAPPAPAASQNPVVTASPNAPPTPLPTVVPSDAAVTPVPVTPEPARPESATPSPASEEPGTPAPATQAPSTPAPSGTSLPAATGAAASPAG